MTPGTQLERPKVAFPETYFSIKERGIVRGGGTLAEMLESNRDDADLCDWLQRAKPGDTFHAGGGAAPRVEVRRVL